ncbi:MAG TPA: GspE/PulE family protein [Verrucomicrobiae bacterium]|jgi:type II secretory ATPase GspE/PulE/Tfp pilus assembly ATPase PilB-like protein|nr:GspE/PulE family protein [Verrucomicrobiae bacterium]
MSETLRYLQSESAAAGVEIGTLVKYLLMDAVAAKASDIHIEPWESTLAVRLRLNGVLTELVHLPLDLMEKISGRFKVLGNMVTYQTGLPQEGHAPADPELGGCEQRISVFPTVRGEKIVVRIFDPSHRSFDLASLGFDEDVQQQFIKLITKPSGLILLTGPTGSGKTTAIYSAIYTLVQRSGPAISIATVEDPVEFNLPMVAQAQVNLAQEFTYPRALRSLMRQDPQVIMVGEIRDPETAAIAVQAGLTGHLVISTIHSGSTAGVFARLINMNIEPFLLSSSLSGVLGMRLIRTNCSFCAQPYEPEPALMKMIPLDERENASFRHGGGCEQCHDTGFSGRVSVCELMTVTQPLRDAVLEKLPTRALQQVAVDHGMQTLWVRGLRRVLSGQTTLEEILRVISVEEA